MTTLARGRPLPLLGNVAFNVGARGVLILLTIISTPVVLHRLGTAAFGVYILAITIGGLLALLDFGLTPALITLLSRAWHQERLDESRRLVGTALTLYLAIGLTGGVLFALLVPWAVRDLLHVPVALQASARTALWLSTAGFAFNMWLAVFNAVPYALQRYDLVAIRIVGLSLLTTLALIVYALLGGVLEGFVLINVAGALVGLLIFYLVSRALLPGVHFTPRFDRDSFRRLARFAGFKFAGTVGGIFTFRFDQFAVGAILGVGAAGLYAIPSTAGQRLLALLGELASPFFPRASTLRGDDARLRTLFFDGSRLLALAATPMLLLLFVLAEPTLRFWIGGAQGQQVAQASAPAFRWLLAALLIQSVAIIPVTFCEAMGKPEINNSFAVASALIHIPLVLLLVPRFGITGAAIALFLNSATQTVVFIIYASRTLFHVGLGELLRTTLVRPLAAATMTAALAYLAARPLIHNRLTLILALAFLPIVYLGVAFLFSAITRDDLARISQVLPRPRAGQ
ncbi:MAG TPA: oligosaccharide flippase family protein [Candidatus Dormibacteraeota bacterium]|nr:oligosaccharide flippase family protein [Candidatus Dormibacteraeota bacterium]